MPFAICPLPFFNLAVIPIKADSSGATFAVKVHPRAKKNAISGELGEALKLSLTAPPVEGKANRAVVELIAELLSVPRTSVSIVAGESSRQKVIRVAGVSAEQVRARLEAHL